MYKYILCRNVLFLNLNVAWCSRVHWIMRIMPSSAHLNKMNSKINIWNVAPKTNLMELWMLSAISPLLPIFSMTSLYFNRTARGLFYSASEFDLAPNPQKDLIFFYLFVLKERDWICSIVRRGGFALVGISELGSSDCQVIALVSWLSTPLLEYSDHNKKYIYCVSINSRCFCKNYDFIVKKLYNVFYSKYCPSLAITFSHLFGSIWILRRKNSTSFEAITKTRN